MSRNGVTGLVCLGSSLVLLVLTRGLPDATLLVPVGPGFYPRIVLSITAVLSAYAIAVDVRAQRSRRAAATDDGAAPPNYALVLLTFAIIGVYIGSLPWLGFRVSTFLFVAVLQATLDPPRAARQWLIVAATASLTTLVTYFVFEGYLNVLLPRGRWTGF